MLEKVALLAAGLLFCSGVALADAKGASTKTAKAKKEGKSLTVSDLIQRDQRVMVRYEEDGEELKAVEVRLLS
jgi:hypothetical protein